MMTTPRNILIEAMRRRVRLTPDGDRLLVDYEDDGPPSEFWRTLKRHKLALLRVLRAKRHTASQILHGEFIGCDRRTWHTLRDSMSENYFDPLCREAIYFLAFQVTAYPEAHKR